MWQGRGAGQAPRGPRKLAPAGDTVGWSHLLAGDRRATLPAMASDAIGQLVSQFITQIDALATRAAHVRIAQALGSLGPPRRGPGRPPGTKNTPSAAKVKKVRKPVSAARRRSMALQGRYLGTLRGLSPADRAKISRIGKSDGVAAAIKAAKKVQPAARS